MTAVTQQDRSSAAEPQVRGLSSAEVQERVQRGETNAFTVRASRTYWQIFRYNLFNIFNLVLFVMLLIVLISRDYATVFFAGFSVAGNSFMGTVQEIHAKRNLDRLALLAVQQVKVWRDGVQQVISSQDIVKDDVIVIEPGDRLAVDGTVIASENLEIDESHLSGESDAINKPAGEPVTSGSFCLAGTGLMVAERVGSSSTVNKLAATAKVYKNTMTPTQKRIAAIVTITLTLLAITGPMVFINGFLMDRAFLDIIRNTIVFTTSMVPQGLILTSILALTIGAVKISRHQTLIQRVNAVESMANVTVLCFDKTGTLTQNLLTVAEVIPLSDASDEWTLHRIADYVGALTHQNSTAAAIDRYLDTQNLDAYRPAHKQREVSFTSARKWGAIAFDEGVFVLGAPERVLPADDPLHDTVLAYAEMGMRVLAFARAASLPDGRVVETAVEPLALIVIRDEIRPEIADTLESFHEQNVQTKVISGDNLRTVRAIAAAAGMRTEVAYTGDELDAMNDTALAAAVREADVFARVEPETKRRVIATLRDQKEYVAMVGDGVNDVPALKEADLAIAMADGAQISKDIADIVLLNNAMSTLPLAFAEGKEITQTMFGTMKMFLAKNFGNTLLFIFTLMMALPFPISPVQISWAAFGTVNVPAGFMALGYLRPKRIKNFRDDVLDYIITAGATGAVGMALMYVVAMSYTENVIYSRSAMTIFFILWGMMIFWNTAGIDLLQPRTYRNNPRSTLMSTVLTGGVVIVAIFMPEIFDFTLPPWELIVLTFLIFFACLVIVSVGMRNRGLLRQFYKLVER